MAPNRTKWQKSRAFNGFIRAGFIIANGCQMGPPML